MDEKEIVKECQKASLAGNTQEVLDRIQAVPEEERTKEMKSLLAWAFFRRGDYSQSLSIATEIEDAGLSAQIYAYVSKADKALKDLSEKHPENSDIWNALVIRARDPDYSDYSLEEFDLKNNELFGSLEIAAKHFTNNLARLYLAKYQSLEDVWKAACLLENDLQRYGEGDVNIHHKAAAAFWLLQAYTILEQPSLAKNAAKKSFDWWKKAHEIDPQNKVFEEKYLNAKKIYESL